MHVRNLLSGQLAIMKVMVWLVFGVLIIELHMRFHVYVIQVQRLFFILLPAFCVNRRIYTCVVYYFKDFGILAMKERSNLFGTMLHSSHYD
jgi:hypothetical protein